MPSQPAASPLRETIALFYRAIAPKHRILSFLVGGSSVQNGALREYPAHPHSDLDIVLLVEGEGKKARGSMAIQGRKVEYFIFSAEVLEGELVREIIQNRRSLARLVSGAIPLFAEDPHADRAFRVARQVVDAPIPELSPVDRIQYFSRLRNIHEDLLDLGNPDSEAFGYTLVEFIQLACEVALKLACHSCPHRKLMMVEIQKVDPALHDRLAKLLRREEVLETTRWVLDHLSVPLGLNASHDWEFSLMPEGAWKG